MVAGRSSARLSVVPDTRRAVAWNLEMPTAKIHPLHTGPVGCEGGETSLSICGVIGDAPGSTFTAAAAFSFVPTDWYSPGCLGTAYLDLTQ